MGTLPSSFVLDDIKEVTVIIFTVLASVNSDIEIKELTLSALVNLMRGDKRIFDAFRPTEDLLNKIRLDELAMNN